MNGLGSSHGRSLTRTTSMVRVVTSVVGGVLVVAMMIYVVANALSRTLADHPLPAALEVVQFLLMPALVSIGFVAATVTGRHVLADIVFHLFPPAGRRLLTVATLVLSAGVLAVLAWFSAEHAMFAMERGFKAGYTEIPSWPMYFLIPIGLGSSTVILLRDARDVAVGAVVDDEVDSDSVAERRAAL